MKQAGTQEDLEAPLPPETNPPGQERCLSALQLLQQTADWLRFRLEAFPNDVPHSSLCKFQGGEYHKNK